MEFLESIFFGNTLRDWAIAAIVAAVVFGVVTVLKRLVLQYTGRLAERTRNEYDDIVANVLGRTKVFFIGFISLYAGSRALDLSANAEYAVKVVAVSIVFIQLALWGNALIDSFVRREIRVTLETDPATATTMNALGFIGRLLLYSVLLLMALANLDVEIWPLLTGLGVGGIAVALAMQNILGDLFASLSIVLDKPFVIGDFIIVGDLMGTVERVGLKTTRVRSLSGEQLIFANSDLLNARVRNYKRMVERRIVFSLGVTYQTPRERLKEIPLMIREIVEEREEARFDRSHFQRYGASSLDFETVYYVLSPDYNRFMDIQQEINLAIFERFEREGIEFAYPTQTLFLERIQHAAAAATE